MPGKISGKKRLKRKVKARMQGIDIDQKKAKKLMGTGIAVGAAFDPVIGVPIGAAGVGFALNEAIHRSALKKRLLKKPKTAAMLAKEFKGTKHAGFFQKIAKKAKKRAELKRLRSKKNREIVRRRAELKRK